MKANKKSLFINWKLFIGLIILISYIAFCLNYAIVFVVGSSMEPNYYDGDMYIATKNFEISRFDSVIVKTTDNLIIKRVVGLPGEHLLYKDNRLYINDKLVADKYNSFTDDFEAFIPENSYYCLGDNRQNSWDSRKYGSFDVSLVYAKVAGKLGGE